MTIQSENINELAAALAKAQGEMENAKKDTTNQFFKSRYADLASVMEAAKHVLAKNGLSVIQSTQILPENNTVVLVTQLCHSSGQWVRSWYPITPVKNDPQGLGSAHTYARRYSYSAIVGIASEDDDGNAASGNRVDEQKPAAFKNSSARNTFVKNVIKSIDEALTVDELKQLAELNKAKLDEMTSSGNEHDALGVDEIRKRYSIVRNKLTKEETEQNDVAASFGQGFADTPASYAATDLPDVEAIQSTKVVPAFIGRK